MASTLAFSNNFHLAASTIAAIYKDRWKVELFFKAIKQNLKLKSLFRPKQERHSDANLDCDDRLFTGKFRSTFREKKAGQFSAYSE